MLRLCLPGLCGGKAVSIRLCLSHFWFLGWLLLGMFVSSAAPCLEVSVSYHAEHCHSQAGCISYRGNLGNPKRGVSEWKRGTKQRSREERNLVHDDEAEADDEAGFDMPQNLVCHCIALANDEERREIDSDCGRARQDNERERPGAVLVAQESPAYEGVIHGDPHQEERQCHEGRRVV